jgi:glutamyl-tRNA reductase
MQIGIIGINHKSGGLELREKLAVSSLKHFAHFSFHGPLSYVLLSTCNRVEIYFSASDLAMAHTYLLNVLRSDIPFEFEHKIYSYFGVDCFFHLAKVTSGLDSAILGETEIQGQVKQAYECFSTTGHLSRELHFLFQKSLKIGKNIRTQSILRKMPQRSIEESVLYHSSMILKNLEQKRILFVGISEINLKILKKFRHLNLNKITLSNRTNHKAHELAQKFGHEHLPWKDLSSHLFSYDLVIFGTKAPHHIVESTDLRKEQQNPILLIDLSVPRNVDPQLALRPKVTLLNIDQLNRTSQRSNKLKILPFAIAENSLLAKEVEKQMTLFRKRESFYQQTLVS